MKRERLGPFLVPRACKLAVSPNLAVFPFFFNIATLKGMKNDLIIVSTSTALITNEFKHFS